MVLNNISNFKSCYNSSADKVSKKNNRKYPSDADLTAKELLDTGRLIYEPTEGKFYNRDKRELKGTMIRGGYIKFGLNVNGKQKQIYAHRAALIAINGNEIPEKGLVCDHINGDRTDNRADNLRLVTQKENCHNPNSPSGGKKGELYKTLTPHDASLIRAEYSIGKSSHNPTQEQLSEKYGITRQAIHRILTYKTYKDTELDDNNVLLTEYSKRPEMTPQEL